MSSLQINQEAAVAPIALGQQDQFANSQQAHGQINSASVPPMGHSGHHIQNIHQLDLVQYHHQNSQFINQIPTDPFAQAALETAMMYVPEISVSPQSSAQSPDTNESNQILQNMGSGIQQVQDGEVEMFEDIVANTNPCLAALPDANLYISSNMNYFDSKRNLLRAPNSHHDLYAYEKNIASEVGSQAEHRINLNDYELDLEDNYSDFSCSEAEEEMLQIFNQSGQRLNNHQQALQGGPTVRNRVPRLNCTLRQFSELALENDEADQVSQAENQSVRNIQLHSLMNGAERSECCCADDDFKDNGLDSTMSISIYDQGGPAYRTSRRGQVSEREPNQINSRRQEGPAHKDLSSKKRTDNLSLGRKYVSRNALSQMNRKDLEEEQDKYDIECDVENFEDFEKMMMLQEEEESPFQHEGLQLNRHRSAIDRVRLADSTSYISKSNQKPDLRKKKSLAVNFREDLNVYDCNTQIRTPQQDSKLIQDDDFLIPISQTSFDAADLEQDKVETTPNQKDTGPQNILGYNKFDILTNQKMESQIGEFDQKSAQLPKRNYPNPRQLLDSNIQYQFLRYNGFKPMNVAMNVNSGPRYSEDKVEHGLPAQSNEVNYVQPTQRFADIYGNAMAPDWQFGLLRYDPIQAYYQQQLAQLYIGQQPILTNQSQIQISDNHRNQMDIPCPKSERLTDKIRDLEKEDEEPKKPRKLKSLLKPASKKIGKDSKTKGKGLKVNTKSSVSFNRVKGVDQNQKVAVNSQIYNQADKENDHVLEPRTEMRLFQTNENNQAIKFAQEDHSREFAEELSGNQQSPRHQGDKGGNSDIMSKMSDERTEKSKQSVLVLSDETLKMNVPAQKLGNDESNEDEVQDQVETQQKRKKWRAQKTKYYQNFDFFFKRSCFRTMTEFYKVKFNAFHEKRLSKLKVDQPAAWHKYMKDGGIKSLSKDQMYLIVQSFVDHIFGVGILTNNTTLEVNQKKAIILRVMMILFSHRHTKRDAFIEQAQEEADQSGHPELAIDFSIIRDVMYKYSKKAEERYFQCETESFMFAAFALSDEGLNFLKDKPDNFKDQEKLNRILRDLTSLKDQALMSLEAMSQGKVLKTAVDSSPSQDTDQIQSTQPESLCKSDESQGMQPYCDLKVGAFLFTELKKMTRNML